ncbi:hypothetical protein TEA_019629 [Camellia sinensis var. sinensis]|uniref:Uncharacterized protein n=1 Tax=Camellia sinensis var. sinensis TaxID=542762 RepID=A0A4S4DXM7_CAMSN|nr:hypothetical protein TEA_019629 [Camellia sinensis var. sinensis]
MVSSALSRLVNLQRHFQVPKGSDDNLCIGMVKLTPDVSEALSRGRAVRTLYGGVHNGVEDTGWRCQTDVEDNLLGHCRTIDRRQFYGVLLDPCRTSNQNQCRDSLQSLRPIKESTDTM